MYAYCKIKEEGIPKSGKSVLDGEVLIPDADKRVQMNTHFWKIDKKINLKKIPNISIFEKKYRKELFNREKNPVLFGYYAHLYLDREFFSRVFKKQCGVI